MDIEEYWKMFLKDKNLSEDVKWFDCFHFDVNEKSANRYWILY